ncbi:MAG: 3-hydroxyisobutyrate dehydrogenase [Pseudomonadota bacterium]
MSTSRVGFIGLGNMGGPMAANLLAAGMSVKAFDLSDEALKALGDKGALACESAAQAASDVDFVVSMLPAGRHVRSLYLGDGDAKGLLATVDPATVLIDCSTIDAESARAVGEAAEKAGMAFVDSPVSGGVAAAQAGTLAFMCGGSEETFNRAKTVLDIMGRAAFHAGPAGAGQVAKACNNMLLAVHMLGTCEALAMGERHGLDPKVLSDIMLASSGRNWSLEVYNPWPGVQEASSASNGYQGGFRTDLMVKDLGLALDVAEGADVDNLFGKLAATVYGDHQQDGYGELDFSSVLNRYRSS